MNARHGTSPQGGGQLVLLIGLVNVGQEDTRAEQANNGGCNLDHDTNPYAKNPANILLQVE